MEINRRSARRLVDTGRRLASLFQGQPVSPVSPLPRARNAPGHPQALSIDAVVRIDDTSLFAIGWFRDAHRPLARLTAVAPTGTRVELLERLFGFVRPDLQSFEAGLVPGGQSPRGFLVFFETQQPLGDPAAWRFELVNEAGQGIQAAADQVITEPTAARNTVLFHLPLECLPNEGLMLDHVQPALSRLLAAQPAPTITQVTDYGSPPVVPSVSLVVPLYGRIDFVAHQLAHFADDPDFQQVDLIYVLDSPELTNALRDQAAHLATIYRLPFRIAVLAANSGFAAATNAGASLARAPLLLLLNSDVLPLAPGWLSIMREFYLRTPQIGALGVKLLYEDDTLQHAGMYFLKPAGTILAGQWQNAHYFKGLSRQLAAANIARRVPATTGACLMIDRQRYQQVGGLQQSYLQGDYEDSDLCLQLHAAGYDTWYLPNVELYHLEGQSYPSELRGRMALYNRWLQTHRWDSQIAALMARMPHPAPAVSE